VSNEQTHYEVMGLEPHATSDEVRKRFRELARKFHPDLHRDHPEYHEVFVRISLANETLSDANRRAAYDLDLRDKARREAARAGTAYGSAPSPPRTTSPRPAPATNGNGHRPNGAAPPRGAPQTRARREADLKRQQLHRLLDDARVAYSRGHLAEALRLCNEAIAIQRVGAAYDLMGDIYHRQSRLEEAVNSYTVAAQMMPNNGLIMAKLNRVAQRLGTQNRDYTLPREGYGMTSSRRTGYKMAFGSFGLAAVMFLVIWSSTLRQSREEAVFGSWTLTHIGLLAACGFLTGIILAAGAWIRRIDQELFFTSVGGPRQPMPLGVLLMVIGAIFYPLAIGVYLIFARMQAAISGSVLTVLACTTALTFGFVFASDATLLQTLLFGGNVIFVAMLCGWFIGDVFRPGWAH
jgi:tetratricopeptide (TPR) repeat protein